MFKRIALVGNLTIALCLASTGAWGQTGEWLVRKASGDVWIAAPGVQQVALAPAAALKPGDQVRTGQNGRALLVRGDESILISPNSTIGLPKENSKGLLTTIIQERGTIVLDVEKRSEKHFEVETPYLVAIVKGTQFRVSVDGRASKVDVLSGQVEVADLKSGKFALVLPGQTASVASNGATGLSLSGRGTLNAIQQGAPRSPRVNPGTLPKDVRANGNSAHSLRINSALGEVKVDFHKVTKGIARSSTASLSSNGRANGRAEAGAANNDGGNQGASNGNGLGSGGGNGSGNGGGIGGGGNAFGNGGGNASAGLGNGLGGVLGNGGCNGNGKGKGSSC